MIRCLVRALIVFILIAFLNTAVADGSLTLEEVESCFYRLSSSFPGQGHVRYAGYGRFVVEYQEDRAEQLMTYNGIAIGKRYIHIDSMSQQRFRVKVDQGYNYVDLNGKEICSHAWKQSAYWFDSGYAWVNDGRRYGLIDLNGEEVVSPEWDRLIGQDEYCFVFSKQDAYGQTRYSIFDINTQSLSELPAMCYVSEQSFSEGTVVISHMGEKEYYVQLCDTRGTPITDTPFAWALPFRNGFSIAQSLYDDTWYQIFKDGSTIVIQEDDTEHMMRCYNAVDGYIIDYLLDDEYNRMYGVYLEDGTEVISPGYYWHSEHVLYLGNGIFRLADDADHSFVLIDDHGHELSNKYDYISERMNASGFAVGYIIKNGEQVWRYVSAYGDDIPVSNVLILTDEDRRMLPGITGLW